MSESSAQWSSSQKQAFPYIQQAVGLGLTATAGLAQYRAGGGKIRDAWWGSLFRLEFSYSGVRDNVVKIPMTYTVPETMFEPVDYDFRNEYVMQMKVRGYSKELGQTVTRWITVEADELQTKQEWIYGGNQTIADTLGSDEMTISQVLEWVPLKRTGVVHF